jgi:hypothetical protein
MAAKGNAIPQFFGILAEISGISHPHGQTLTAVNGGREVLAANRGLNHVLHLANVDSVAGGGFVVYFDFKIRRAGGPLGIEVSYTWDRTQSARSISVSWLDLSAGGPALDERLVDDHLRRDKP